MCDEERGGQKGVVVSIARDERSGEVPKSNLSQSFLSCSVAMRYNNAKCIPHPIICYTAE